MLSTKLDSQKKFRLANTCQEYTLFAARTIAASIVQLCFTTPSLLEFSSVVSLAQNRSSTLSCAREHSTGLLATKTPFDAFV